jgi:esterase
MRLHFQSHGAGFPVIILHGLLGSLDNWQPISRALGESFKVFAVDLRNHGRSPHSEVFDYAAMAGDLLEIMETHRLPRAHLIGHSLGGKTAMHFALAHAALAEKLVIVDMAPRAYPPEHVP